MLPYQSINYERVWSKKIEKVKIIILSQATPTTRYFYISLYIVETNLNVKDLILTSRTPRVKSIIDNWGKKNQAIIIFLQ